MTIREALRAAAARLDAAGVPDAEYDAGELLAWLLGEERLRMRLESHRTLAREIQARYDALIARRESREPLQYIMGEAPFMGLTFHVERGVLIPRYDTEVLCAEALRLLDGRGGRVLDIGTGSGALAVSIAKLCPAAQVTAVDVSDTALRIASRNAQDHGVNVRFVRSDCFCALEGGRFDMIVSNPPYIPPHEMAELMPEVRCEPELALAGGEDGLVFYRRIAQEAPAYLAPGGWLLFEIGWQQKDDVCALLREHIGEPYALRDLGGNWRVCAAQMKD